jgi:hypothetical protein
MLATGPHDCLRQPCAAGRVYSIGRRLHRREDNADNPVSWYRNVSTQPQEKLCSACFFSAPSETRTPDPLIKSQLLYQLS